MVTVKENHLEWALKHLQKYYHSDFYPKIFEFQAISHNWEQVKAYILSIDLDNYSPKSPQIDLAPKPNGTFRIVHQLDPIDSLIYTALIREVCEVVESYRIPEVEKVACSYRIKPDLEGSFFSDDTGWDTLRARSGALAEKYSAGFVMVADITDFYNQIYTHRIENLIEEAGKGTFDDQARILESFLLGLNKKTSRGIPVGPAPSIVLSELIMASIDKAICPHTKDFVRYADDITMFFQKREDAIYAHHELTQYLYTYHRLVFSGEKTKVLSTKRYLERYTRDEEQEENAAVMARAEGLALGKVKDLMAGLSPYEAARYDEDEEYEKALAEVMKDDKFDLLSKTYYELLQKSISVHVDYALVRHVLRRAARYRIRRMVPLVLDSFERLLPVIRETVVYLNAVINKDSVTMCRAKFESILSGYWMRLPFVNLWISYLLQNQSFVGSDLPSSYSVIRSTRDKALIALRNGDTTWIRGFRDGIDALGPWDKRAVLYCSRALPFDEMTPWVEAVGASGDVVESSIARFLVSEKKSKK
jgi:hypothetical protein